MLHAVALSRLLAVTASQLVRSVCTELSPVAVSLQLAAILGSAFMTWLQADALPRLVTASQAALSVATESIAVSLQLASTHCCEGQTASHRFRSTHPPPVGPGSTTAVHWFSMHVAGVSGSLAPSPSLPAGHRSQCGWPGRG